MPRKPSQHAEVRQFRIKRSTKWSVVFKQLQNVDVWGSSNFRCPELRVHATSEHTKQPQAFEA
eukprot:6876120-Alexandrium_andersonii.AAC.1